MQRVYVGGRLLTFSSYPDFSFRDEWSGLFMLDKKLANYIAVKTRWGWAAPENALPEKTVVSRNSVTYTHAVNGHNVRVHVVHGSKATKGAAREWSEIRVEGSQENEMEIGICGRHVYDDKCADAQVVNSGGKYVVAGNAKIFLCPDGSSQQTLKDPKKRTHIQGCKEFDILVITVPFREKVRVLVEHSPPRLVPPTNTASASFHSDSQEWNELYRRAVKTVEVLTKRYGWYAGLPWFVQYWGRDSFISLPALVREGYPSLAKKLLLRFLHKEVDGEIPRLIREDGSPEFGSVDTNPLFLNAFADYVVTAGDYRLAAENKAEIMETFMWILDKSRWRLPTSNGKDTWMDTLETRKYPIEIAAYVIEAARKLARAGVLPDCWYSELRELWAKEKKKYLIERSANVLLAAVYNIIPAKEAVEKAREWKLFTEWGVRSWSPLEVEYDPEGYHTGAAWGLTTAAGLYVALKARDWETSNALLRALLKRDKWTGYLDEVWDAHTGAPLGADVQLWTATMVIRAIDEVIIDRRCVPPGISKIKRVRWERGHMKRVAVTQTTTGAW